jgi:hypothetical protein
VARHDERHIEPTERCEQSDSRLTYRQADEERNRDGKHPGNRDPPVDLTLVNSKYLVCRLPKLLDLATWIHAHKLHGAGQLS